jgi:hypothetical protein
MKNIQKFFTCFCLLTAPLLAPADNAKSALTVNDVAAKPESHLGHVAILGVVAIVTPGKGFVLVDQREYDECGLSCLTEKGTKKVPVRWIGAAPKLEATVRVEGTLSQSNEGLTFAAQQIVKQ